jgi:hypothetical protein
MRQVLTTALLPLSLAVLLTACASSPPVLDIRYVKQQLPETLLECADVPAVPANPTQRAVADYIVDLWDAHEDCKSKLGEIRGLTDVATHH